MRSEFDTTGHFGELASEYDAKAFSATPGLAALSRSEVQLVLDRLGPVDGRVLLDAGVGTGRLAAELVARGGTVVGVDVTPEMLSQCRDRVPSALLVLARLGANLPLADGCVDGIASMRVFKYISDWRPVLTEFRRLVRPGGKIVFEVANRRSVAVLGHRGMPVHLATLGEARAVVEACGLVIEQIDGGSRVPAPVYARVRSERAARAVEVVERAGSAALGEVALTRNFFLTCRRES